MVLVLRFYVYYKLNRFLCRGVLCWGNGRLVFDVVSHRPFCYGVVFSVRPLDAVCCLGSCPQCPVRLVCVHGYVADLWRALDVIFCDVLYRRILVLRHARLHNPCEDVLLRQEPFAGGIAPFFEPCHFNVLCESGFSCFFPLL